MIRAYLSKNIPKMVLKRTLICLINCLSIACYAQDVPISVQYSPSFHFDQSQPYTPYKTASYILVDLRGMVKQVNLPPNTPALIENIVRNELKAARFTPYIKNGIAIEAWLYYPILITPEETYADLD